MPETCECDTFDHVDIPCPNEPDTRNVFPALCNHCLFYCLADEED